MCTASSYCWLESDFALIAWALHNGFAAPYPFQLPHIILQSNWWLLVVVFHKELGMGWNLLTNDKWCYTKFLPKLESDSVNDLKSTKILLKTTVNDFGLPIGLWVVCWTHPGLSALKFKEFMLEIADENGVPITHNWPWYIMQLSHMFENNSTTLLVKYGCANATKWAYTVKQFTATIMEFFPVE